jgi:hypothetical protein
MREGDLMADECPPLELLCAFIDCNVTEEDRAGVVHHLVRCQACYELVVSVIKSMREVPDPVIPPPVKGERQ